jgi:uncharacterized membrane protein YhaH (DUF805 family)
MNDNNNTEDKLIKNSFIGVMLTIIFNASLFIVSTLVAINNNRAGYHNNLLLIVCLLLFFYLEVALFIIIVSVVSKRL